MKPKKKALIKAIEGDLLLLRMVAEQAYRTYDAEQGPTRGHPNFLADVKRLRDLASDADTEEQEAIRS